VAPTGKSATPVGRPALQQEREAWADAAGRVWQKLRQHLARSIGPAGFDALLRRALALAKTEFPSLQAIRTEADGRLMGLPEVVQTAEESEVMNGHRFELDLPSEPLAAQADPDKVRQVFNILVENAVRYSPKGGTVTVGARRNADRVEVRVVDEGIGIPASERDRIFRKFYRAESAARDGAAGTGLGLFIAKELVTAMGGRIWVDSTEGEGSSFSFELPAARE